jgi:hypothetical protein
MNARIAPLALAAALLGLALVGSLAGCKKSPKDNGPTCRQIVSYMMRFRELGAFDERGAIEDCRKQQWTKQQRQCLYTAKDLDALAACVPAIKVDSTGQRKLPLPEWHPRVDQPIETGPERLQREAAEKAAKEAAGAAGATAPPGAPAAPAPPAAPAAPDKPM